ncbi:MAG: GIY-YIG nuclease family protein [bacterium]|nr:GIY-YIG nuclease family protein [bacterium]MDA1024682.1 GIY-YIG nuclease family protein [bacterium]
MSRATGHPVSSRSWSSTITLNAQPVLLVYQVYILKCSDSSYYVGQTTDSNTRLKAHATGTSAIWTRNRLPVRLMYLEEHLDRTSAMRREKQIKSWSRIKKERLFSQLTNKII